MSKNAVQLFVKHVYRWNFEFNTMHICTMHIYLWIFKQGTGNNILDFCLSRIRKLISFRKHKITCIFKSWQGGLLPLTVDQDSEVKTGSRGCCLLINILWGDVCLNSLDLSAFLQHHCSCKYVFESHLFKWIILSTFRSQN